MKLTWSDKAIGDLEQIGGWIGRDDPGSASRLVSRLWKRATALKTYPRMGRVVPERGDEKLRELVEGNIRIVYRIERDRVVIVTVFDAHRLFVDRDDSQK